jgi:glutamate dehydrogenase (NAD(P)+)
VQMGGAKAGVRGDPADRAGKAALMARFCAEITPLTDSAQLLTGPDMGTVEEDFAPLRERRAVPAAIGAVVDDVPFEDVLTGFGVAAAAEAALGDRWGGGWEGRSAAIEGFGKVGSGVAREVTRRGGQVAAVSTVAGCVADPAGLDVERLLTLRRTYGDACVLHYGRRCGTRPGRWPVPANAPTGSCAAGGATPRARLTPPSPPYAPAPPYAPES